MSALHSGKEIKPGAISLRLSGAKKSLLEIARQRLVLGATVLTVAFFGLSLRLTEVVLRGEALPREMGATSGSVYTTPARANILDRNDDYIFCLKCEIWWGHYSSPCQHGGHVHYRVMTLDPVRKLLTLANHLCR